MLPKRKAIQSQACREIGKKSAGKQLSLFVKAAAIIKVLICLHLLSAKAPEGTEYLYSTSTYAARVLLILHVYQYEQVLSMCLGKDV